MKNHILPLLRVATLGLFTLWVGISPAANQPLEQFQLPPSSIQDTIKPTNIDSSEFVLQGIARSGDTGKNFDHIYIDVYKIMEDGSVELVQADRFPGGDFEIWLRKHERYMLLMNYNNRAYLEGRLNPADAMITDGVLNQIFILDEYRPELRVQTETTEEITLTTPKEETTTPVAAVVDTIISSLETPKVDLVAEELEETPEAQDASLVANVTPKKEPARSESSSSEETRPSASEELVVLGTLQVSESTSFRKEATHLSDVILRFTYGDAVALLEKTNRYWWKVQFKGKIGWIKAAKLEQNWF